MLSTLDELAALVAKRRIEIGAAAMTETPRLAEVLPLVLRQIQGRQPVRANRISGETESLRAADQAAGVPVDCGGFSCPADGVATMRV